MFGCPGFNCHQPHFGWELVLLDACSQRAAAQTFRGGQLCIRWHSALDCALNHRRDCLREINGRHVATVFGFSGQWKRAVAITYSLRDLTGNVVPDSTMYNAALGAVHGSPAHAQLIPMLSRALSQVRTQCSTGSREQAFGENWKSIKRRFVQQKTHVGGRANVMLL